MADWDEDGPRLTKNLAALLGELAAAASSPSRPAPPTLADVKAWHRRTLAGLKVPHPKYVGAFRGEPGLEGINVRIGRAMGVSASDVAGELAELEATLHRALGELDGLYPNADALDEDGLRAVTDVAGWVHAEWVRIHPFANGNGRTARLWANVVLMRYGIAPVIRLRPRPDDDGYAGAAAQAMRGDWEPMAAFVRAQVVRAYAGGDSPPVH